jgi:DNA-binding CsgD family transcriptional regulator
VALPWCKIDLEKGFGGTMDAQKDLSESMTIGPATATSRTTHDARPAREPVGIAMIGSGLHFCNQLLRSVEEEFQVSAVRADTLDDFVVARDDSRVTPCLLVVDETHAESLLADPERFAQAARNAPLALAYRSVETARAFQARWADGGHAPLGFLPMRLPLDTWLSALRLLVNQLISVPMEVYGTAPPRAEQGARGDDAANALSEQAQMKVHPLTNRERQVVSLLADGQSNKQIAARLAITEHTVKLHVHNAFRKMGVRNRTAAATAWMGQQTGRQSM